MVAISVTVTDSVVAENSTPPGGPYRSMNGGDRYDLSQNTLHPDNSARLNNGNYFSANPNQKNRNMANQKFTEIPSWVNKRQAEMEDWRKQNNIHQSSDLTQKFVQRPDMPEWVKQQQVFTEKHLQQSNISPQHGWNKQHQAQWNNKQVVPMVEPNHPVVPPQGYGSQVNRKQQYFPAARGPVFGPGVPPAGFNNQHSYQVQQYRQPFPPAWR